MAYTIADVLSAIPVVELMKRLVKDAREEGISHISPGTLLTKPDPLYIDKQIETVRPEQAGSQFEYRTLPSVNWGGRFLAIGRQMFELNTWHLDAKARDTLREQAGW